ncbi:MAG TPA: hypothetical protein VK468_07535 [Pyrinomonadaceae bacterium]|jgi:hypothetical protein|nr:hypothetical protein [Pyrinomonadaceae bacterium]
MKTIRLYPLILAVLVFFAFAADGQTRKTRRSTSRQKAPSTTIIPTLEIRTAKEKVSIQIANVTRFTDVLGPIAAGIEAVDRDSKSTKLSKAVLDKNEANKQKVLQAIRNLKAGLVTLETEFRTKTGLRKFLPKIDGITVLSSQSEDSAFAGRFMESRKPLLTVLQKLSDTLAAMS